MRILKKILLIFLFSLIFISSEVKLMGENGGEYLFGYLILPVEGGVDRSYGYGFSMYVPPGHSLCITLDTTSNLDCPAHGCSPKILPYIPM
jgi:hypothetical protein